MSLVARYLEQQGLPTVIIGSALDIVQHCRVPRYLHVDFPLGNPCGKPFDRDMQRRIVTQGLTLLEKADTAGALEYSAENWGSDTWRDQYMEISDANREELKRKGEELRARRATRQPRDL